VYRLFVSRIIVAAFIVIMLAGQLPGGARADVGLPPVSPSGSSLSPEDALQTNVRMVSEVVDLTVEPYERPLPPDQIEDNPGYWMRVLVDAQFVMRNLGEAPEAFEVWFPLAANTHYPDYLLYQTTQRPEIAIQDFRVRVDGQPVPAQQVNGPVLNQPDGESPWGLPEDGSPWATFPVEFPPGEDVLIRVRYTLYPGGRCPFGDIEYILQTGAGWRDTIGEATITAHLPHEVTPESVSLSSQDIFGETLEPQPAGYVVEGDTITWHFTDLEPTAEDNIYLNVLEPQRYERLLEARRKVEQVGDAAPLKVAAAYLELARAAREAVLIIKNVTRNGGGKALGEAASGAYRRSLELDPEQASVYSEYARWLLSTGGWQQLEFEGTCPPEACELVQRGLEKFPQYAALQELDQMFRDSQIMYQTEVAYITQDAFLTATQQALQTQRAMDTQAAHPTGTPIPIDTALPPTPVAQASLLLTATPPPTIALPAATSLPTPASPGGGFCPGAAITLALASLLMVPTLSRRRR
jgi:hypothetical protein